MKDESPGKFKIGGKIKFKTTMPRSRLCDYGGPNMLVNRTITHTGVGADIVLKSADERNKNVTLKNCAPFTNCFSKIYNTQIYNAKDLNFVMVMYNLIEYNSNCGKTSAILWQYHKDVPNT